MLSLIELARRIGAYGRVRRDLEPLQVLFGQGFHADEGGWRWMSRMGDFVIPKTARTGKRMLRLSLTCGQAGYYDRFPFGVRISVNGRLRESCIFNDGEQTHEVVLSLPPALDALDAHVHLEAESAFVPAQFWISRDARELSIRIAGVTAVPAVKSAVAQSGDGVELLHWQCNVCGHDVQTPIAALHRETPSCPFCASSVRMRAIVHMLASELFGRSMPLSDLPTDRALRGIGLSDWAGYADVLAGKFNYTNTFYHQAPRLDIMAIDPTLEGKVDFLICTEVFEHVPPPISRAFENARRLLKPTGVMIFSTPYGLQEEAWEHFPELHHYKLVKRRDSTVLINTTAGGRQQEFRNLIFHGGPGATLEMRLASLNSLRREFLAASFVEPRIYGEDVPDYGICWAEPWSLPMTARPA